MSITIGIFVLLFFFIFYGYFCITIGLVLHSLVMKWKVGERILPLLNYTSHQSELDCQIFNYLFISKFTVSKWKIINNKNYKYYKVHKSKCKLCCQKNLQFGEREKAVLWLYLSWKLVVTSTRINRVTEQRDSKHLHLCQHFLHTEYHTSLISSYMIHLLFSPL